MPTQSNKDIKKAYAQGLLDGLDNIRRHYSEAFNAMRDSPEESIYEIMKDHNRRTILSASGLLTAIQDFPDTTKHSSFHRILDIIQDQDLETPLIYKKIHESLHKQNSKEKMTLKKRNGAQDLINTIDEIQAYSQEAFSAMCAFPDQIIDNVIQNFNMNLNCYRIPKGMSFHDVLNLIENSPKTPQIYKRIHEHIHKKHSMEELIDNKIQEYQYIENKVSAAVQAVVKSNPDAAKESMIMKKIQKEYPPETPNRSIQKEQSSARKDTDLLKSEAEKETEIENRNQTFDVAIVCALEAELEKVKNTGPIWKKRKKNHNDPTRYYETTYTTNKGNNLKVVAGTPTQMGMPASAVLATKMILHFSPKLVVMVGIAAGAKQENQNNGDILVPLHTYDYGSGKLKEEQNEQLHLYPDPKPLSISENLSSPLGQWVEDRTELDDISKNWPVKKKRILMKIHTGALGSGSAVLNTDKPIKTALEHWRKLIGIEMEAYGVHLACAKTTQPPTEFLCMKSVCDFGSGKNDEWHDYAAYTAAQLCYRFLIAEWEDLFPDIK